MIQLVNHLSCKHGYLSLISWNPSLKIWVWWCTLRNTALGQLRQVDSWGFLFIHLSLLGEFQANERVCLKRQGTWHQRNVIQDWPPASTHVHLHRYAYTHLESTFENECQLIITQLIVNRYKQGFMDLTEIIHRSKQFGEKFHLGRGLKMSGLSGFTWIELLCNVLLRRYPFLFPSIKRTSC